MICPPDWRTVPTATSWCSCGRMRRAVGRRQVVELVADHNTHRTTCHHHTNRHPQATTTGRRAAA
nr:hypothetical protein [Streptomyces sp. MA3_2.13]